MPNVSGNGSQGSNEKSLAPKSVFFLSQHRLHPAKWDRFGWRWEDRPLKLSVGCVKEEGRGRCIRAARAPPHQPPILSPTSASPSSEPVGSCLPACGLLWSQVGGCRCGSCFGPNTEKTGALPGQRASS